MRKFSLSKLFIIVAIVSLCLMALDVVGVRAQTTADSYEKLVAAQNQTVATFSWVLPTKDINGAAINPLEVQADLFWRIPVTSGTPNPWKWFGGTYGLLGSTSIDITFDATIQQPHEFGVAFSRAGLQWSAMSTPILFTMPAPPPALVQTNSLTIVKRK